MLLGISAILVPLCLYVQAVAPTPPAAKYPRGREKPQDAVYNFLQACQSKNYRLAARHLNLNRLPPYHGDRTHKGLGKQTPAGRSVGSRRNQKCEVLAVPRVGSL